MSFKPPIIVALSAFLRITALFLPSTALFLPSTALFLRITALFLVGTALFLAGKTALKADEVQEEDVLFEADKVIYNREQSSFEAFGNVQMAWEDHFVKADYVRYFEKSRAILAKGNILWADPSTHLLYAQEVNFSGDWKTGEIKNFALILDDQSRLTARSGTRSISQNLGLRNQMRHATYSPCTICSKQGSYPLWQISASTITHYERSQTLYYTNVFLEFFGVPILYLPFFSHPDPQVKKRTGFLIPEASYSSLLGFQISLPYMIDIKPQTQLILKPTATSKQGALIELSWAHILSHGQYHIDASYARDYDNASSDFPKKNRGHVFSHGRFGAGDSHLLSYALQWASDDSYLNFYNLDGKRQLTSHLNWHIGDAYHFLSIEHYLFQDYLAAEINRHLIILPYIRYHGQKALFSGRLNWKANGLVLHAPLCQKDNNGGNNNEGGNKDCAQDKSKTHIQLNHVLFRLSGLLDWQKSIIWQGHMFNLTALARYDFYHSDYQKQDDETYHAIRRVLGENASHNIRRFLPLIALEWSFPLWQALGDFSQIIEPHVQLIWTTNQNPYKDNPPNEDGGSFVFSSANLLALNRFSGIDEWENGSRANIGLKWRFDYQDNLSSQAFIGGVLRLRETNSFDEQSGLDKNFSDIVAHWVLAIEPFFYQSHEIQWDSKKNIIKNYEAALNLTLDPISFSTNYNLSRDDANGAENQQIRGRLALHFHPLWKIYGSSIYNLARNQDLKHKIGLIYQDECFGFNLNVNYDRTDYDPIHNQNRKPVFEIGLRLSFRNLGSVRLSGAAADNDFDFEDFNH